MNLLVYIITAADYGITPGSTPSTNLQSSTLTTVLQIVFGIAGGIALLIVVISGLQFVLSQGDPQRTAKARNAIIYALVGLLVCILAFSIVTFVVGNL